MKTTSSKVVFSRIARVLRPQKASWRAEAKSFVGEAIKAMKYGVAGHKVYDTFQIKDHRFIIPTYMKEILYIEYNNEILDRNTYRGATVGKTSKDRALVEDFDAVRSMRDLEEKYQNAYNLYLEKKEEQIFSPNDPNLQQQLVELQQQIDYYLNQIMQQTSLLTKKLMPTKNMREWWDSNPGVVVTSFESGDIIIHYVEMPTDKDGFFMILDDFNYIMACFWYASANLLLCGYSHETLTYDMCDYNWKEFRDKVRVDKLTWTTQEAEQFTRMWLSWDVPGSAGQTMYMNDQNLI